MFALRESPGERPGIQDTVVGMRILVLGGTRFLSHAVAADAVARGHEVVCAARGTSGAVPAGARLVTVDRDAAGGLDALRGEEFDAVVDVAIISHRWVVDALDALADTAAHWTFVSTGSVYADHSLMGTTEDAPLLPPIERHASLDDRDAQGPDLYGSIKVASENAVRDRLGDRAFIPRPGLITGPGDRSDRFGYWPARMWRGGQVVVPDTPDQPFQYVDVRDHAAWIVDAAERRLTGTYNTTGRSLRLGELFAGIAAAVRDAGGPEVELVAVAPERLTELGVQPWAGPTSLPCWLPDGYQALGASNVEPALAAGLRIRPLADATLGALDHERTLGLDRDRKAGLTPAEEAGVLDAL